MQWLPPTTVGREDLAVSQRLLPPGPGATNVPLCIVLCDEQPSDALGG